MIHRGPREYALALQKLEKRAHNTFYRLWSGHNNAQYHAGACFGIFNGGVENGVSSKIAFYMSHNNIAQTLYITSVSGFMREVKTPRPPLSTPQVSRLTNFKFVKKIIQLSSAILCSRYTGPTTVFVSFRSFLFETTNAANRNLHDASGLWIQTVRAKPLLWNMNIVWLRSCSAVHCRIIVVYEREAAASTDKSVNRTIDVSQVDVSKTRVTLWWRADSLTARERQWNSRYVSSRGPTRGWIWVFENESGRPGPCREIQSVSRSGCRFDFRSVWIRCKRTYLLLIG